MNVGLLSSASALAVVGYTGSVIYHGHLVALLDQLAKDKMFLAWMASAGILYFLSKQPEIGGPVRLITGVAILAALLKIFSGTILDQVFADFQAGKIGLAQLFEVFANTAGTKLGLQAGGKSQLYQSSIGSTK